jgi:deoxyribonuclease-4
VPRFGSHMSMAGGHYLAVHAAHRVGFSTVQVFTKSNNQWKAKPLTESDVMAFKNSLAETGVSDPVGHNSYLINLASPDDVLWNKSIAAMVHEVERGEALGLTDLVAHPGAHVGSGEEAGIGRIVQALDIIHGQTRGVRLRIALETTAGQGSNLGNRFEHLGAILERVADPDRLGICVDSCHIFAAGYPLETPEQYNQTMAEFDLAIGLSRVRLWHLNDSVRELGSRVDRHAGIGRGRIGVSAFSLILNDSRFLGIPMILETPKGEEDGEDLDAINLRTLTTLVVTSPLSA